MKPRSFLIGALLFVFIVWGATFVSIYCWDRTEDVEPDTTAISPPDKAKNSDVDQAKISTVDQTKQNPVDPHKRRGFGRAIDRSGQFGDSFGATTSLFTGLGLLSIAFAFLQQEETNKQQEVAKEETEKDRLLRIESEKAASAAMLRAIQALNDSAKALTGSLEEQRKITALSEREANVKILTTKIEAYLQQADRLADRSFPPGHMANALGKDMPAGEAYKVLKGEIRRLEEERDKLFRSWTANT